MTLLSHPKMYPLYPFVFTAGLICAYFISVMPIILKKKLRLDGITEPIYANKQMCEIMVLFGVADSVGSILVGKIVQGFGFKYSMLISGLVCLITALSFYIAYYAFSYGIFWYITGFGWGFSDCIINILFVCLLSDKFPGRGEPFGVYNFIKNIGVFVGILLMSIVKDIFDPYIIILFFALFSVISSIIAFCFDFEFKFGNIEEGTPYKKIEENEKEKEQELKNLNNIQKIEIEKNISSKEQSKINETPENQKLNIPLKRN